MAYSREPLRWAGRAAAIAPPLAGHGTQSAHLAGLRFKDWVEGMRPTLREASEKGPVILAGLSLGALVCLQLTLNHPAEVAGLVLLSNALWLRSPFPDKALDAVEALHFPDFGMPKFTSDIGDRSALAQHASYGTQPVHAALSLKRAGERLRGELGGIECPTLLVHGAGDRVCPVDNSWRAAERLGSNNVRVVILPRSRHIITRDFDKDVLSEELETFFGGLAR